MICPTGKMVYDSRQEAVAFIRRTRGVGEGGNRPYRCSKCGFWHLGRKMPKHVQRARRRYMEGRFEDERRLA